MLRLHSLQDNQLITALKGGAVGVIRTDTTYGVVALAANRDAVARLYQSKARESKPGTVIAASMEQLVELGIQRRYLKAVEHLWPNPLSIVVPTEPNMAYLDFGMGSLAVRIPSDPEVTALLQHTGALLTTSANDPGHPVATTIAEAEAYFGDKLDFYVDGGNAADSPASTIIRMVDDEIEVLRQGAVKFDNEGRLVT